MDYRFGLSITNQASVSEVPIAHLAFDPAWVAPGSTGTGEVIQQLPEHAFVGCGQGRRGGEPHGAAGCGE